MEIKILQHEYADSPREDENLGTMVCFHKQHNLGDEHDLKHRGFVSWDSMEKYLRKELKATHILPLYLFDHSDLSMNTTGFSCPWDSGQVGLIYTTSDRLIAYGVAPEDAEDQLRSEVEIFDRYLSGDIWSFVISDGDEVLDSCCGIYGREYAETAANEALMEVKQRLADQNSYKIVIDLNVHADSLEDARTKVYRVMNSVGGARFQWGSPDKWFRDQRRIDEKK